MPSRLRSLVGWSARVFGDDIAIRVFSPLVADWQHEADAHVATRARAVLHARWLAALARTGLVVSARELGCWRVPRSEVRQVMSTAALCGVGGQCLLFGLTLMLVVIVDGRPLGAFETLFLFVQFATVMLPLALGPVAARLAGAGCGVPERRWMLGSLALVTALVQLLIVGWGEPAVLSLVYSAKVCTYGLMRPQSGIPLHEVLRSSPADAVASWWVMHGADLTRRLLWIALPAAISVFAWRLGSRPSARRDHRLVTAWCVPALLLLVQLLATFWLPQRGWYGVRATLVRGIPVGSLLVLAWWLGSTPPVARESTLVHTPEAR